MEELEKQKKNSTKNKICYSHALLSKILHQRLQLSDFIPEGAILTFLLTFLSLQSH